MLVLNFLLVFLAIISGKGFYEEIFTYCRNFYHTSFAQEITATDAEQYCILRIEDIVFSNKISIDVDFGQQRNPMADNRMRDEETKKLIQFRSRCTELYGTPWLENGKCVPL